MEENKDKKKGISKAELFWAKIKMAWRVIKTGNIFAFVDDGKRAEGMICIENEHEHLDLMFCSLYDNLDNACKKHTGKPIVDALKEREKKRDKALKEVLAAMEEAMCDGLKATKEICDNNKKILEGDTFKDSGTEEK